MTPCTLSLKFPRITYMLLFVAFFHPRTCHNVISFSCSIAEWHNFVYRNLKPAVKTFWSLSNVTFITLKACVMLYLWSSQYFQIHKFHKPQNSGNAKPDNYLDTCVAVTYFLPCGLHSFKQCYILPEQKKRSCILCSLFHTFLLGQKR